ncbi:2Fe-2S iron-sulfur cluster-binding protein [Spongiibacter taiwanensis]|uniref:2Fe-2S iron-sulfur cluster-binding protein n=1 Tax=Spongiibacter taiwanensis TaxID=1748242 RepID=UPI002034FEBB|nr:2Fe-2S iron-sulfur cluster-binding protein [Spongiibacter taiwanensis]USA42874.1 2Fe-2S iron-sulfur cluster-binding protein [Spongiibacter taiwanensis]
MVNVVFRTHSGEETAVDIPEEGNLMEAAVANNISGIAADCGGSMVCGTCHVMVAPEWQEKLPEQSEMEKDILSYVPEPQPSSRLTCQIPVTAELEGIVLQLPEHQH